MHILLVLAIIAGIFLIVIFMQPSDFRVTRSTTIIAPASIVFEQINNLHNWNAWSPWAKLDPNAENTFEGPVSGTGAIMRWSGNKKIGMGSMTITESVPYDFIHFRLEFLKPFIATNTAEFIFKVNGNQTEIAWSMLGKPNFINKAMNVIMDCQKMVGSQFEQGLAQLKIIAESAQK
jgi:hypothetical protein